MIAIDTSAVVAILLQEPEADVFLPLINIVAFDAAMFEAGADAFLRSGKGRGHPAKPSLGDCLSHAVAKVYAVPLLFKSHDFVHTDLVPAYSAAS